MDFYIDREIEPEEPSYVPYYQYEEEMASLQREIENLIDEVEKKEQELEQARLIIKKCLEELKEYE